MLNLTGIPITDPDELSMSNLTLRYEGKENGHSVDIKYDASEDYAEIFMTTYKDGIEIAQMVTGLAYRDGHLVTLKPAELELRHMTTMHPRPGKLSAAGREDEPYDGDYKMEICPTLLIPRTSDI